MIFTWFYKHITPDGAKNISLSRTVADSLIVRLVASLIRNRVEKQRKRRKRLSAILRAEAEEDDLALAHRHLDQRGLTGYLLRPERPTG